MRLDYFQVSCNFQIPGNPFLTTCIESKHTELGFHQTACFSGTVCTVRTRRKPFLFFSYLWHSQGCFPMKSSQCQTVNREVYKHANVSEGRTLYRLSRGKKKRIFYPLHGIVHQLSALNSYTITIFVQHDIKIHVSYVTIWIQWRTSRKHSRDTSARVGKRTLRKRSKAAQHRLDKIDTRLKMTFSFWEHFDEKLPTSLHVMVIFVVSNILAYIFITEWFHLFFKRFTSKSKSTWPWFHGPH